MPMFHVLSPSTLSSCVSLDPALGLMDTMCVPSLKLSVSRGGQIIKMSYNVLNKFSKIPVFRELQLRRVRTKCPRRSREGFRARVTSELGFGGRTVLPPC